MSQISVRRGDDEAVRIALGGIVAVRLCRSRWYWQLFAGAYSDLGIVADFFRGTKDAKEGVEFNVKATATAISSNWAAVENLAGTLVARRGLSHQTASAIAASPRLPRRPLALHATAAPGRGRRWITSFALGASMCIRSVMAAYYTDVQVARVNP
ncbi:MAG TPA: hypothetical protein VFG23_01970 [Polyangia bacterium]|nr:hypothetical protein [Polyangia bacterium]